MLSFYSVFLPRCFLDARSSLANVLRFEHLLPHSLQPIWTASSSGFYMEEQRIITKHHLEAPFRAQMLRHPRSTVGFCLARMHMQVA
jgi:hypothetical protein